LLAFTHRNRQLRAVEKPRPKARRGWATVRVRLAGICNTDLEILRGYHDFHGTLGHEFLGEVQEVAGVGPREKRRWSGKRVAGEINIACRALGFYPVCGFCRRGLPRHCARRKVLGIVGHDGAFAEYLTLPLENLHPVPDCIADEQAVFVEPLAAACEILEQVAIGKFREAAVLGDGKLAQLIARVLRTELKRIVLYGKHAQKLRLVRQAGIETRQVRGDSSDLTRVKERFALLVEATGSPTGLELAQHMTEARGTLVLKSTFHGTAPVATWPTVVNELTVVGSRCGPFDKALALLRSRQVDPRPLVSRTLPLAEAPAAMGLAQKPGIMKVLLKNG
jgi:threonine dehydrogenase-like Zn-dependent dehydrogenase